jgi:hypothetical protein
MSVSEITHVHRGNLQNSELRGGAIDIPRAGSLKAPWALHVAGWVLGKDVKVEAVEMLCEGVVLSQAGVRLQRPDVAAVHKLAVTEKVGFSCAISLAGLPGEFEIHLNARLADGSRAPFGVIRGRRPRLQPGAQLAIQPLMVTGMRGRIGRTWLMHVLAQHPNVVAYREYPYETYSASYWMHMLRVLSAPANHEESSPPDRFQTNSFFIGAHPYNYVSLKRWEREKGLETWFSEDYVSRLARFCQESIDGYYKQVGLSQGQPSPRYFAEKHHHGHVWRCLWELYPHSREILLLRDLRDVICSVFAFNAKRGFVSFGRDKFNSDVEYIRHLRAEAQRLATTWKEVKDKSLLIKYEDLIKTPTETMQRIFRYLDLPAEKAAVDTTLDRAARTMPELSQHRTTKNATESVGRWQRDLSPELRAVCNEELREVLREFEYV